MLELNLIDRDWFLAMQFMYISTLPKNLQVFFEKIDHMSIAFQRSTKELEKIANQLSALRLIFSFCAV